MSVTTWYVTGHSSLPTMNFGTGIETREQILLAEILQRSRRAVAPGAQSTTFMAAQASQATY
jgi:hypothetical protein